MRHLHPSCTTKKIAFRHGYNISKIFCVVSSVICCGFFLLFQTDRCDAWVPGTTLPKPTHAWSSDLRRRDGVSLASSFQEEEWTSDFDGFIGGDGGREDDDSVSLSEFLSKRSSGGGNNNDEKDDDDESKGTETRNDNYRYRDLTAVQTRMFSLGKDLIINDYVGNMGFEEVTDWEYYYEDEDDPDDRDVVNPNPFDSSKPKRTRTNSGSVVRVFRGEFIGRLGGTIRSKGLDSRILVKEFTGSLALKLANNEQRAMAKLQSVLVESKASDGGWVSAASSRSALARTDDANVVELLRSLQKAPYLGILGEVDLAELLDEEEFESDNTFANDFYRALGVPPPSIGAIWIVYEYQGLNTVASYTMAPPAKRRAQQPPKKSFWGGFVEPPALPKFEERSRYIVKGIMAQALSALATLHEAGIAHRSLGRNSLIITSPSQNKAEASSIYFTRLDGLSVKLSDFGFAGLLEDSARDDPEFVSRASSFGLSFARRDGTASSSSLAATNFAMAEDLHALGFVFLGLLLVSLSELPIANAPMPSTDEDTIQKLLGEIFDGDFDAFRDYVEAEEVWSSLVELLDDDGGAGWDVLRALFKARETTAENQNSLRVVTARGLLSNRFFQSP
mmetsp:Transcript_23502/g.55673  ORF Transcript_23502/g.55673 Transcript_23502/m.55673 type:complete len:619 (-) Transcript_23502:104-1960(-)